MKLTDWAWPLLNEQFETGFIMLCSVTFLMISGVFFKFFSRFFELFLFTHWVGFIMVLVYSYKHGAKLVLFLGGVMFGLDLLIRLISILINKKATDKAVIK